MVRINDIDFTTVVTGMSDSPGWMTPRSFVPKGGVTPPAVQWLPTERLDTA